MMSDRGMNAGISIDEMSFPSLVAAAAMTTVELLLAEEERPLGVLRAAGADADIFDGAAPRRLGEARAATGRDDDEAEEEEAKACVVANDGDRQRMASFLKEVGESLLAFLHLVVG